MGDFTRRPTAQVSFRDAELEKTETGKRDSLYHRNMSDMNTVDSGEVQPELFKERWLEGLIGGQDTEAQARRWAEEQTLLARKSNLEILNSRLTWMTAAEALILSAFTQIYPRNPLQFNEPVAGSTIHFCSYGQTRHVCRALSGAGQIVAMAALLGTLGGLLNDIDFYRVLRKTRPNRKRFGNDPYRGVEHYKSDFRRVMKDMEEVSGGNDWCFFYVDEITGKRHLIHWPSLWHCCKLWLTRINYLMLPLAFVVTFWKLQEISEQLVSCQFPYSSIDRQ